MNRNVPFRSIIQDLKSEYPDVPERIIVNAAETYNGYLPLIRAALDNQRGASTRCGRNYGHMRTHHRSGDSVQPTRPVSFPNFDQVGQALSVDVNNDNLPNPYQMEAYNEFGLRPPPNRLNTSSPRMESEYVHQQRQSLQSMEDEVKYLDNYLRTIKSDVRCREQLLSQREFGSDQKFPSKSDVDRLRQEVARIRWEAEYLDRTRNPHIPAPYVESPYLSNYRSTTGIVNSVSAPGTPDAPPYHHNRGHRPPPPAYNPGVYQYNQTSQLMPQRPPVPPPRSYSTRPSWNPGGSISPRVIQQPMPSGHPPPNVTPPPPAPFRRGHSRTPSDGSRQSRHSSHRNSQASLGEVGITHGEEEENGESQWSCSKCTFKNHPAMRLCEMCETPRTKPADL